MPSLVGKLHLLILSTFWASLTASVTSKKLPIVHKSCPKMISQKKLQFLTPLQKLAKNVVDLGKLIVATGSEKLLNIQ